MIFAAVVKNNNQTNDFFWEPVPFVFGCFSNKMPTGLEDNYVITSQLEQYEDITRSTTTRFSNFKKMIKAYSA